MFFAYILYSSKLNKHYYGSCSDLQARLKEHEKGKVRFTKGGRPWSVHHVETFETRVDAMARERYFKSIEGYHFLRDSGIIPR